MKANLIQLRAEIAERQRLAGVSLADALRLQQASKDIFASRALTETVLEIVDRIEDYTQQLLELDARIEQAHEVDQEVLMTQLFPL